MPTAKRLQFSVVIAAPPAKVWSTMLEQESYREWTWALERLKGLCERAA
jgi:uncharacterized protein YndB with AHSA1/START domain